MPYVLKRTDQAGGYVAKAGQDSSYTQDLGKVRFFRTMAEADAERCVENEVIEEFGKGAHDGPRQQFLL